MVQHVAKRNPRIMLRHRHPPPRRGRRRGSTCSDPGGC
jgi:hypothetical protein